MVNLLMATPDPTVVEHVDRAAEPTPTAQPAPLCTFQVKNLSVWYGEKRVIDDMTLDVASNAVTAIIGPSGCGKSTFLRCLNRMHELVPKTRVEGTVLLQGDDLYSSTVDPALDPIATAKIEELIHELKADYTIVTVTHNMQQAGRVSDYTAFLYLGRLIEFGPTTKIFTNPSQRQTEDYITGRFG